MKMKTKLVLVFLLSISMSVIIFMFSIYYILQSGYFSGVTENKMQNALESVKQQMCKYRGADWSHENISKELIEAEDVYQNMNFAILSSENEWMAVSKVPVIESVDELLDAVEHRNIDSRKYYVLGKGFAIDDKEYYLICFVQNQKFEAMSYSFNLARGQGILGKLAIFGFIITVIVTGVFMLLFSRKTMHRVYKMYDTFKTFTLENSDVRMDADAHDELGTMANNFNGMAEKIQSQFEEKKRYEKNRKELVSNISHDLRTPLSSILGYSEMLQDEVYETKVEQQQYIDVIRRKAEYMDKLLTELLECSRLDIGTLVLCKQQFDLAELIREILIEYYMVIEQNKFELQIEFPNEPIIVEWDRERMGRVLRNLIDNALKYGMDGNKIRLALIKEDNRVRIEIQDYGMGMPQNVADHIFECFYRGDTARNSKVGGMGLGMFIASEIVQKHNGEIHIISQVGHGTTVQCILPVQIE